MFHSPRHQKVLSGIDEGGEILHKRFLLSSHNILQRKSVV